MHNLQRAVMDRPNLTQQIREWNANRLDLFELSEPNEHGEFWGVMRFYYQDDDKKVSTKCIRVSNTAKTRDVLDILIEKFRPDLRMLSRSQYALYEVHATGDERKLLDLECPLLVQLNWGKDDREGRFLLKKETNRTKGESSNTLQIETMGLERRLSRREKKELKKQEKEAKFRSQEDDKENTAQKLYSAVPESSFTRSISNPEMVMRRRRQLKLERKLQEIRTSDGGPNSGGTLKIYGDAICPEVPYKTLLLSINDTAHHVVRETLQKYGIESEDPQDFCLVQVLHPSDAEEYYGKQRQEFILDDDDCPLDILSELPPTSGPVTFRLIRRPPGANTVRSWVEPSGSPVDPVPYIVEINSDGSVPYDAREFSVPAHGLEIGLERSLQHNGSFLKLVGPDICRQQCLLSNSSGTVTVTPLDKSATVIVNGHRINSPCVLNNGATLLLGRGYLFRLIDPTYDQKPLTVHNKRQLSPAVVDEREQPPIQPITGQHSRSEDVFPATIDYRDDAEDEFVRAICSALTIESLEFKLIPTYIAYMAARHLVSRQQQRLTNFTTAVSRNLYSTVQKVQGSPLSVGVCMANASELLNFFSRDVHISPYSAVAQNVLSECVQMAFFNLVDSFQRKLHQFMPMFVDPAVDARTIQGSVLNLLSSVISMLLRARVNAALTIQLFSQLFHFMNVSLFNQLVSAESLLCTRAVGRLLLHRLRQIEDWAEKQGLELAAECHLARIIQAATVLNATKNSLDDIDDLCSSCFKLNSLQLHALFSNYIASRDEPPISTDLIKRAVIVAQNTADVLARKEGTQITLFEDVDLQLPFLLPEDGYSCDFVKGLSDELVAYLEPLQRAEVCRLIVNSRSCSLWTVYLDVPQNISGRGAFPVIEQQRTISSVPIVHGQSTQPADVITVTFQKINNSIGLSIVATVAEDIQERSIYVKSVIPEGAAARDGRLQAGDQLLEVDGRSLMGLTQEQAAEILKQAGQKVTLLVAKQVAQSRGLATVLQLPPSSQRDLGSISNNLYESQSRRHILPRQPGYTQRHSVYVDPTAVSRAAVSPKLEATNRDLNGPIYAKPHAFRNQEPPVSRSKSASNIYLTDDQAQPSNVAVTTQPQLAYRDRNTRETRERVRSDFHGDMTRGGSEIHRFSDGTADFFNGTNSPTRSQPMVDKNHRIAGSFSSQPEISDGSHDVMFTSQELLMRAQPGKRPVAESYLSSTSSNIQQSNAQAAGVPVGGHLRALNSKSLEQVNRVNLQSSTDQQRQQDVSYNPRSLPRGVTLNVNPWEREQKEVERRLKAKELRRQREEEIRQLESLHVGELSTAETDRLRRLKLQVEFDRRASETEHPQVFHDNETDMTPAGRAQVVHHLQLEIDEKRRQLQQEFEQRDRQLALNERIRTAEQERRLNQLEQASNYQGKVDIRRSDEQQTGDLHQHHKVVGRSTAAEFNLNNNNGNELPVPPERTSSYSLYQTGPVVNKMTESFMQSNSQLPPSPAAAGNSKTMDRQNLAFSAPPTPGVVGAQELYRDPRERIQAARLQSDASYQTPERMSFRDKMRHFASEAGEDTPVEKPKISRAQQRIEMSTGRQ